MRQTGEHTIICDGKYHDGEEVIPCEKELHPGTHAVINKVGVLGHHCDFCHDPLKTQQLAKDLGYSEDEFRGRFHTFASAEKALTAKKEAEAQAAEDAANQGEKLPVATFPDGANTEPQAAPPAQDGGNVDQGAGAAQAPAADAVPGT